MSNEESSVRVAVRIRPQTPGEVVEGCGVCARAGGAAGEGGISLGAERAFTFDFTFEPSASQHELYQTCVRKLVEAALDGYNATVLAYGQTGSGKTYTMGSGWEGDGAGDEELRGIIPRAIRDLFSGADQRAEDARTQGLLPPEFSVQAQFIELYNEDIVDLLDPAKDPFAKGGLRITEDGCGGVRIVGASMRPVRSATEALAALRAGALARTTAATNMNSSSSRSHAVFTLMMRQRRLAADQEQEGEKDADTPEQYETLTAKFHFVDLAGSERLKRTGATGERAREGISINCGLLALGNVISALGDKSRKVLHVPYRDSKLTRLLQDSLGGNSNTVMIACVSPSDRDFMETLNTLKYANRARNIKNRCVVNQDLTSRTINQLRQEVARLQLELAEYKQGKRVINESGEEGWSDVVQENAILTGEVEALRRRVKAMQGTIDQLSARNSELVAEKALATWAPSDTSPEANDCSLTTLVQGYVSEIEDLRAQLMEANALYSASRQRTTRTRHESVMDTSTVIDDAKRELYKEKELLARSMGELEFQRKLNMSGDGRGPIGERERAEGESAEESDLEEEEESDEEAEEDAKQQHALSAQLAALSDDMDTKERLIEQLEISQRRLESLRQHYEQRLDTLHHQIRAASDEKDKVLASLASQSSPPSDKLKRVKSEYETRISGMSRELRRLQAAARDHQRLQRAQRAAADQLAAARHDLAAMKRDKVKLIHRMREEAKRHAQTLAARAKEVAQLKKESRKNANLIRSLEAETKLKEQVLKRKQEEVSLLRRGHRDKLSNKAAGRIPERRRSRQSCQQLWARLELYVERAVAARSTLAELEATLDAQLRERDRATEPTAQTRLRAAIADTQAQIMQIEEETDDTELSRILDEMRSVEAGRFAAQQLCARALLLAHHAAAARAAAAAAAARLHQAEEKAERLAMSMRAASPGLAEPPLWGVPAGALAALLAKVSSGTSTRSVSPDSSMFESRPRVQCNTAPASPPDDNSNNTSPFLRNTGRRGSVRLRDLGVVGREEADGDVMTQSLVDAAPRPAPLCRVPSAPASLKAPLTPTSGPVWSPLVARRVPPESPRVTRRSTNNTSNPPLINTTNKPPSLEASISCGTPPASPGAARRLREEDVFLRLTGATSDNSPQGVVKEVASKRVMGGGAWLQCTHVCEGHAGAVLSLLATSRHLYSGGVDRTVRAWDVAGRGEAWRGSCGGGCGGGVTALAGGGGGGALLAAAGGGVRVFDPRAAAPAHTLWSSGGTAVSPRGEQAVTGLALAAQHRLYMAVGDKLRLWDLRMMECVCKLWSGHAAAVMCLAVGAAAGGADFVATGSKDHYVRTLYMNDTNNGTWEGSSRRLLEPPHYDGVQALALCGDVLYSGSRDSSLKTWTRDGSLTHSVMNAHKGWVTSVCPLWSGGGEQVVATAGRDAALRVWGGGGGGPGGGGGGGPGGGGGLRPLAGPLPLPDAPHALAAINHTIYTAGNGGEVRVWRLSMEHSQVRFPTVIIHYNTSFNHLCNECLEPHSDGKVRCWRLRRVR